MKMLNADELNNVVGGVGNVDTDPMDAKYDLTKYPGDNIKDKDKWIEKYMDTYGVTRHAAEEALDVLKDKSKLK